MGPRYNVNPKGKWGFRFTPLTWALGWGSAYRELTGWTILDYRYWSIGPFTIKRSIAVAQIEAFLKTEIAQRISRELQKSMNRKRVAREGWSQVSTCHAPGCTCHPVREYCCPGKTPTEVIWKKTFEAVDSNSFAWHLDDACIPRAHARKRRLSGRFRYLKADGLPTWYRDEEGDLWTDVSEEVAQAQAQGKQRAEEATVEEA